MNFKKLELIYGILRQQKRNDLLLCSNNRFLSLSYKKCRYMYTDFKQKKNEKKTDILTSTFATYLGSQFPINEFDLKIKKHWRTTANNIK